MKGEGERKNKGTEREREREEEGYVAKERNKTRLTGGIDDQVATTMLEDGGDVAIAHDPESGNKKTNRQARVAFVARGTAAITCQL